MKARVLFYQPQALAISLDRAMKAIRTQALARAFCSTANLGVGFDGFCLALKRYSDLVSARITSAKKIRIIVHGPEGRNVPVEVKKNSAGPPALDLARKGHLKKGLEIIVEKRAPQGLGLGSSGTHSSSMHEGPGCSAGPSPLER